MHAISRVPSRTWAARSPTASSGCGLRFLRLPHALRLRPDNRWLDGGYIRQYSDFGTLRDEGRRTANPDRQWMHSATTQAVIGYRVSEALTIDAYLPYIVRSYRRPGFRD